MFASIFRRNSWRRRQSFRIIEYRVTNILTDSASLISISRVSNPRSQRQWNFIRSKEGFPALKLSFRVSRLKVDVAISLGSSHFASVNILFLLTHWYLNKHLCHEFPCDRNKQAAGKQSSLISFAAHESCKQSTWKFRLLSSTSTLELIEFHRVFFDSGSFSFASNQCFQEKINKNNGFQRSFRDVKYFELTNQRVYQEQNMFTPLCHTSMNNSVFARSATIRINLMVWLENHRGAQHDDKKHCLSKRHSFMELNGIEWIWNILGG